MHTIAETIKTNGGFVTTKEIGSRSEYRSLLRQVKEGNIVRVSSGVYALSDSLANTMIDLPRVIPDAILCGYSAWSHYGLTTQVPASICVAIERDRKVRLPEYPPITLHSVKREIFRLGETTDVVGGYEVPIYDVERCVCDAVKSRNKIGVDVSSEILKSYLSHQERNIPKLMKYAKALRVAATISKYLEIQL